MTERKSGTRIVFAALSLAACAAVGAYFAFAGFNGHPEEVSAKASAPSATGVSAAATDGTNQGSGTTPTAIRTAAKSDAARIDRANRDQLAQDNGEGDGRSGKQFNDWTIRCQKNDAGEVVTCEAFQRLSVRDTGQRFLELAVGFPQDGGDPAAVFVLPLGLWLPPGMDLQIDDGDPMKVQIHRCIQGGCLVQIPLNDELLAQMKRGEQLAIQVYRRPEDPIAVPISLIGFTAALDEIRP